MNAVERIDFWIAELNLDPSEVWGLIEERCAELEVTLDYGLAEDLVQYINVQISTSTSSSFIIMTENIIDRDKLQEAMIQNIIDGMDWKTMEQYVYDSLNGNFDDYTLDELITEAEDYYPELLEDTDIKVTYGDTLHTFPQEAS